jgi:hypothetical protein
MGSNSGKITFNFLSCSRHVIILHYTQNSHIDFVFSENLSHASLPGGMANGVTFDSTSQVR